MKNSKFVLDRLAKLFEQGLLTSKDLANDILDILGEPYIKSKIPSSRSGLGLGTFLGKTLLNRKNAEVFFKNKGLHNGARVIIKWKLKDLHTNF